MTLLTAQTLSAGYGARMILEDLDLAFPSGEITAIVGANACGKSTLLRCLARLIRPLSGQVVLDGQPVRQMPTRALARKLGLLPQSPIAPDGISVAELVSHGRHPHHGVLSRWTPDDDRAVAEALDMTRTADLAGRDVDQLSGGQKQRVWIAMALAQNTDVLLLDEPTTFLDIAHQIDVLELLVDLNRSRGTTIVMVLHDLNLAARYADHLVAMRQGQIYATGSPDSVLTETMVTQVFGLASLVMTDPVSNRPMMIPLGRQPGGPDRPSKAVSE
ncbi:ABC transporter ATP-binding protein [Pseudooceanicola sp. C21-150M6]|uniref:ABC transporter ATP-binding protein n=1 Tax=Pseudooceanicola sp. C21-150M6 TaxID=3434355 RepID=UPI003D7F777C